MEKLADIEVDATGAPELVPLEGAGAGRGDGPYAVSAGGLDLVLVRTARGPRVYQGRCPHQGALLGEGELDGGALVCRNHRWRFDAATGKREGGPQCLVACPVSERNGQLLVDLSPLMAESARERKGARAPDVAGMASTGRQIADLPGPRALPLLGNALQMDIGKLHNIMEGWAARYGPLCKFRMGPKQGVLVSAPDLAAQVLRARPDTYSRTAKLITVFEELHVNGVFSADGAAWRPQRRLSMEALSHRHLRGFYPTLHTVAERLRARWKRSAASGEVLDVVEELKRFTVDVTTALTFGYDVNTIEQTGDDLVQRRLELFFPAFNRRIFALFPLWRYLRLPRDRRLARALGELRSWMDDLVVKARARSAADPAIAAEPANFLEAMLSARDDAGQPFSDKVIFANLMTMLLAGEDTTAYTLAWAVHHMCDSPAAASALRTELDAVLGGAGVPGDIETANRLLTAGAVANETMRLRPVAPLIFGESLTPTTVGDVQIPTGTVVVVLTRPPARDVTGVEAPTSFRPERWLEAPAGAGVPSGHIPFGSGPRICPGRSLALLEMKVVLALLYKNFDVTRVGRSEDVRETFAFTMSPAGLRVRLSARPAA